MCSPKYILLLAVFVLAGFFILYFQDVLSVDIDRTPSQHKLSESPPFPNDRFDRIFWFIQITDLHISKFYDKERIKQFNTFCSKHLDIIKPELVVVTGDLTDAKHANLQGSEQYLEEWLSYWNVLQESKALEKTIWLDIRGNHDSFNVPYLDHKDNYFNTYSNQGRKHKTSYRYIHKKPYGEYAFIGVDSCPDPGPKRPFNFFGMLTEIQMKQLEHFRRETSTSNTTIWMGHYPSSVVVSPNNGFKKLISTGSVYLCGHLHTLAGFLPEMYTMHKNGNLELELGDWKDNRIYRIMAIDHDLLSFTDVTYGQWPIILITNPKHATFNLPQHEPTGRMLHSSFIRILVWSDVDIEKVDVSIDGARKGPARFVKEALYVVEWNPSMYSEGLHEISVRAVDVNGKARKVNQPFSLDNTEVGFAFFPRLLLMTDVSFLITCVFFAIWIATIFPLVLFRMVGEISVPVQFSGPLVNIIKTVFHRTHLLACTNSIYYPLVLHTVYLAFGPWFIGFLLDDYIGLCFVFGVYVNGQLLPMYTTYAVGIIQLLFFNIPLCHYLGGYLDYRLTNLDKVPKEDQNTFLKFLRHHWLFVLMVGFESFLAFHGFYLAYGTMAFVLGPVRTWSVFFAFYMRRKVKQVSRDSHAYSMMNGAGESIR